VAQRSGAAAAGNDKPEPEFVQHFRIFLAEVFSDIQLNALPFVSVAAPQQTGLDDCGVHAFCAADCYAHGRALTYE
jgi:hypothetical protein